MFYEERLNSVTPSIFTAILTTQGDVIQLNHRALEAAHIDPQKVLGQPLGELPYWTDSECVCKATSEAAQGEVVRLETTLELNDAQLEVELILAPLHSAEGEVTQLSIYVVNISERKAREKTVREKVTRQQLILENVKEHVILLLDAEGVITACNSSVERILGYRPEELEGHFITCIFTPEDVRSGVVQEEMRVAEAEGRAQDNRWHVHKDGSSFWADGITTARYAEDGSLLGFAKVFSDDSKSKLAEQERDYLMERLERKRAYLEAIFQQMPSGVSIAEAPSGKLIMHNEEAEKLLGHPLLESADYTGYSRYGALHPDGQPYAAEEYPITRALLHGETVSQEDMHYRRGDGRVTLFSVNAAPVRDADGTVIAAISTFHDISGRQRAAEALHKAHEALQARVKELDAMKEELERVNDRLYHDAFHDALTGLPNRLLFTERLEQALKRQVRHSQSHAAVLFLDFDRFKVVNDSLGHAVGDGLLTGISQRLQTCVRPSDTVARLGGDEFVILLEEITHTEQVTHVAQRITEAFYRPLLVSEHDLYTSASIGIVSNTAYYTRADDVLRDADLAMYRAKAKGRGTYQLFNQRMHQQAMDMMTLERELRDAVTQRELRVAYQPILAVANGTLLGFEALVRWQHPKRGLISPALFLPLAEETGLIREIDRYVWTEACRQVRSWQLSSDDSSGIEHPLTLSINLSSQHFLYPELVQDIESILTETDFPPEQLVLEITEGALIRSSEMVSTMLRELKELGLKLYLDDFGTGYSSLSYLQRFPVDALKIDRSFIDSMTSSEESAELVRTIINMAQNLGLQAVAEGVETEEQLERLRDLGCSYTQGYLFAKPLSEEQAEEFMTVSG